MDRNQLISISLLVLLGTLYFHLFGSKVPPPQAVAQPATTVASIAPTPIAAYGPWQSALQGQSANYVIENEHIRVTFAAQGGAPVAVELKKYQDYQGKSIKLLDVAGQPYWQLMHGNTLVDTRKLFFTPESVMAPHRVVTGEAEVSFSFVVHTGEGQYVRHRYSMSGRGYTLRYMPEIVGYTGVLSDQVTLAWDVRARRLEKNRKDSLQRVAWTYVGADNKFQQLKATPKAVSAKLPQALKWVAYKQRFFTAGLIAEGKQLGTREVAVQWQPAETDMQSLYQGGLRCQLPLSELESQKTTLKFYFGPNEYQSLTGAAPQFDRNLSLGWRPVRWLNVHIVLPLAAWLSKWVHNPGILILLLAVLLKFILLPLAYRSQLAMAKMQLLKPRLEALKKKYKGDTQRMQLEQVALYRELGINPLSGCMPVLLQAPVLITMFNFFHNSIALRQTGFLWAADLSTYDSILNLPFTLPGYGDHVSLFAMLMTISTVLYTWSSGQMNTAEGPMKMFSYFMPIMFMFIFNSFPAGLSFFYFVTNMLTFAQQMIMKRFVNTDVLETQFQEAKDKKQRNTPKPRAQVRLEKALAQKKKK